MRAPAKRYLKSLSPGVVADMSERECVQTLIVAHMRGGERVKTLSWFGRLLWKVFGRWL
jgi:hypothetical protein